MKATFTPSKLAVNENVSYILRDALGKIKPLFQLNSLGYELLKAGKISAFDTSSEFGHWTEEPMLASNLITNAGLAVMASRFNGADSEAAVTYIALGTGATAANVTDTTLVTEISTGGGSRAAATASRQTTTVTNDTSRLLKTFSFTSSFAVTESGIFNAASSGDMAARQVFSAINVSNGDSLQVTWDIDFAAA